MATVVNQVRGQEIFASQTINASASVTSGVIDFGNARWAVITFLATFNAAATNGATINIYPNDPVPTSDTRQLATYSSESYSIPYASGAQVHSVKIEVPSQQVKIKFTNEDSGQTVTLMSASFVAVND